KDPLPYFEAVCGSCESLLHVKANAPNETLYCPRCNATGRNVQKGERKMSHASWLRDPATLPVLLIREGLPEIRYYEMTCSICEALFAVMVEYKGIVQCPTCHDIKVGSHVVKACYKWDTFGTPV